MPGGADAREGRAGPPERAERRGRGPEARRGGEGAPGGPRVGSRAQAEGLHGASRGGLTQGQGPGGGAVEGVGSVLPRIQGIARSLRVQSAGLRNRLDAAITSLDQQGIDAPAPEKGYSDPAEEEEHSVAAETSVVAPAGEVSDAEESASEALLPRLESPPGLSEVSAGSPETCGEEVGPLLRSQAEPEPSGGVEESSEGAVPRCLGGPAPVETETEAGPGISMPVGGQEGGSGGRYLEAVSLGRAFKLLGIKMELVTGLDSEGVGTSGRGDPDALTSKLAAVRFITATKRMQALREVRALQVRHEDLMVQMGARTAKPAAVSARTVLPQQGARWLPGPATKDDSKNKYAHGALPHGRHPARPVSSDDAWDKSDFKLTLLQNLQEKTFLKVHFSSWVQVARLSAELERLLGAVNLKEKMDLLRCSLGALAALAVDARRMQQAAGSFLWGRLCAKIASGLREWSVKAAERRSLRLSLCRAAESHKRTLLLSALAHWKLYCTHYQIAALQEDIVSQWKGKCLKIIAFYGLLNRFLRTQLMKQKMRSRRPGRNASEEATQRLPDAVPVARVLGLERKILGPQRRVLATLSKRRRHLLRLRRFTATSEDMDWIASEAPGVSSSFKQLHFPNPGGDAGAGLSSRQGLDSRSGIPRSLEIVARNEELHEVGEPARSKTRGGHQVFPSPASARAPSRPRPDSPEAQPSRQVFSKPASARTQPRPRPVSLAAEGGRRVFTSPASEHAELPAAGSEIWGGGAKDEALQHYTSSSAVQKSRTQTSRIQLQSPGNSQSRERTQASSPTPQISETSPGASRGAGIEGPKELPLGHDPTDGVTPRRPFTRAAEVKGSASAEHELPALLGEIQTQENVADFGSSGDHIFERLSATSPKPSETASAGLPPDKCEKALGSSSARSEGGVLIEETSRRSVNCSSRESPSSRSSAEDVKPLALDDSKDSITPSDARASNATETFSEVSAGRGSIEIDETATSGSVTDSATLTADSAATVATGATTLHPDGSDPPMASLVEDEIHGRQSSREFSTSSAAGGGTASSGAASPLQSARGMSEAGTDLPARSEEHITRLESPSPPATLDSDHSRVLQTSEVFDAYASESRGIPAPAEEQKARAWRVDTAVARKARSRGPQKSAEMRRGKPRVSPTKAGSEMQKTHGALRGSHRAAMPAWSDRSSGSESDSASSEGSFTGENRILDWDWPSTINEVGAVFCNNWRAQRSVRAFVKTVEEARHLWRMASDHFLDALMRKSLMSWTKYVEGLLTMISTHRLISTATKALHGWVKYIRTRCETSAAYFALVRSQMGVIGKDYFRVWQNRLESQLRVQNILFRHVKQSQRRVAGRSFSGWKVFTSYKRALEQKLCYGLKAIMRWRSQRALQKWKTVMRNRALLRRVFRRAQASWERRMQRGTYHADYWSMLRALERWSAYCRTKSLQRAWLVLDSTAKIFRKHALLRAGLQAFHWGIYTKSMVAYNKKVLAGALRQWQSVLKMNRPQGARGKMLASCGLRTEYQYARRSAMRKAFSALKRLCIAGCWAPKHLYHIRLLKASLFEFLRHICKAQVLEENWERLSRSLLRRAREAGSRALLAERHAAVRSTYRVSRFNELWIERICFNSWVIEMALKRKAGAHRSRVVQGAVLGAWKRATVSSLCSQTVSHLVKNEREQRVRASLAAERDKHFLHSELAEELLDRSTLLHYDLRLQIRAMAAWKIYLHFANLVLKSSRHDLRASAPGEPLQFPIAHRFALGQYTRELCSYGSVRQAIEPVREGGAGSRVTTYYRSAHPPLIHAVKKHPAPRTLSSRLAEPVVRSNVSAFEDGTAARGTVEPRVVRTMLELRREKAVAEKVLGLWSQEDDGDLVFPRLPPAGAATSPGDASNLWLGAQFNS